MLKVCTTAQALSRTIPYPLKHLIDYPRPRQRTLSRPGKCMTIGIGFRCDDGVVLCADTQITVPGILKHYQSKLRFHVEQHGIIASCYSGYPSLSKVMNERLDAAFVAEKPKNINSVKQIIEDALIVLKKKHPKEMKWQEFLYGISFYKQKARLLHTEGSIIEDTDFAVIGIGNSSLIRYLVTSFRAIGTPRTTDFAMNFGVYSVSQAKNFIDGCGGKTEAAILKHDGELIDCSHGDDLAEREAKLQIFEDEMSRLFQWATGPQPSETEMSILLGNMFSKIKRRRPRN